MNRVVKNVMKNRRKSQSVEVRNRANKHFNAIVEQLDAIRSVATDLVIVDNIRWDNVGSLAHIRDSLADILEGWEELKGVETWRDET